MRVCVWFEWNTRHDFCSRSRTRKDGPKRDETQFMGERQRAGRDIKCGGGIGVDTEIVVVLI